MKLYGHKTRCQLMNSTTKNSASEPLEWANLQMQGQYFIPQLASVLHPEYSAWRQSAQPSPLFQSAVSRGPRL